MPVSVDVGILERSSKVMLCPEILAGMTSARGRPSAGYGARTSSANVTTGDAHLLDCADNVVHADSGQVVMYGVNDLVVVTKNGLTLVTTTDKASDLKRLIESLSVGELERS